MGETFKFDYYYGIEAEQFSFYRVPRLLVKDRRFKGLSSDAKLLYGLMLDRMSLSIKNGWLDEDNRAYIHYTVENIMEDLGCAKATCAKILAELDNKKGIGLIEKKRQGLGKPDIIYVMNFAAIETTGEDAEIEENAVKSAVSPEVQKVDFQKDNIYTSRSSKIELLEVQKLDFKKFNICTPRSSESELPVVQELNGNYNNNNYTNMNYINPINPSLASGNMKVDKGSDMMDEMDSSVTYIDLIKQNIDYEHFMMHGEWQKKELFEELFEVICEVVCVKRKTVKIGGEDYPYELVKSKFLKLENAHLQYVINCMQNTSSKITNIKAYMLTSLYNASNTINHYYQQEVQHDMYGGI